MYFEEKLDLVLQRLDETQQLLELFIPDLRKKRNVAIFLGITEQSLNNWLRFSDAPITEGEHYKIRANGDIEFVPNEIIILKRSGGYKNRRESKKEILTDDVIPANNPATQRILQKIGKMPPCEEIPKGNVL